MSLLRRGVLFLPSILLLGCSATAGDTRGDATGPVAEFVLSFLIDGSLRESGLPFEAFAADVQTLTSDLLLAQSGDRVLFIGLRATPTWSSWNGDPAELLLGPLRIAATSVFFHKEQLPRFDSVAVAYNDPVGTAVEMTAEDFDAYGRGAMTDDQALTRMVISGSR